MNGPAGRNYSYKDKFFTPTEPVTSTEQFPLLHA